MANTVFIEPVTQILISKYEGDQTRDTLLDMSNRARPFIQELRSANKPVHMLVDTAAVNKQDSGARAMAVQAINSLDYDKMAIFGANVFLKHVLSFVMQLAIKKDRVKYFNTQEEARSWLTQ